MCRPPADPSAAVLERLQQQLNLNGALSAADHLAHVASRGSGPRIFCGHVPPECSEELVKAHFSQWGHVTDVYFPKRKDTFRRRPFCFVTFNRLEDAQRALAESPMNICGIPIKQLNLVEDRADYYKHRHHAAQHALVQALQTLALLGNEGAAGAPMAPAASAPMAAQVPAVDLNNLAALLSLENTAAQLNASRPQPYPMHQPVSVNTATSMPYDNAARYSSGALPFANLPGFSQVALTTQSAGGLAMPAVTPSYEQTARYAAVPPRPQPAYPATSAAALAAALAGPASADCRLGGAPAGADWHLPAGVRSPFSTLDLQHGSAGSSPPKSDLGLRLPMPGALRSASGSSGSASPDLDAAAANRLAMWQLQNELLAGEGSSASGPGCEWGAPQGLALPATATVN